MVVPRQLPKCNVSLLKFLNALYSLLNLMDIESIHTRKETLLSLNVFGSTYLLRNHGMIYEDGECKETQFVLFQRKCRNLNILSTSYCFMMQVLRTMLDILQCLGQTLDSDPHKEAPNIQIPHTPFTLRIHDDVTQRQVCLHQYELYAICWRGQPTL